MTNINIIVIVVFAACCVSVSISILAIIVCTSLRDYFSLKREEVEARIKEIERMSILPPDHTKNLQYSKEILEFVKAIIAQEAVMYFRDFSDSHIIEKVTLSQVKKIVTDVANRVNRSMKRDSIDFSITVFNEDFYNHYIIECSKDYIKQLLEKYVVEVVSE